MSRVKKRWYRVLSILCAAIFALTSVPQTGMTALASEEETKQEEIQNEAKRSAEEKATVSGSDEATPRELTVSDNDDVLLGQDEIPEKNTSFKAASVSDGNTPAEQDKVTLSFQVEGSATIQNDSGETITSLETVKGSTEELTFQVVVSDGYVIKSVRPEFKGMIYVKSISSDMPGKYKITPDRKAGGYQGNVTIIVTTVPLADYQATFVCPEGAELQVFKDDTAVTPENGVITLSNSEYLSFKVKPAEGLTPRVTYTSASDEMAYVLEEFEVDAEGYYVYNYGKIFENHVFSIEMNETYQITFHSNYGGFYMQGVELYKSDETMDSYDMYMELEGEYLFDGDVTRVIKGQPYYFYLGEGPMCYDSRLVTTTGDESGRLTAFTYIDDMSIYKVTPTEDTDLTVLFEPHTISVIKDADALETFTIEAQEEYQSYVTIAQDQSSVGIFDWTPLQVTYKPKTGMEMMAYTYSKSWVEDIEDENGNIIDQRYEYYRSDMDVTQNADGSYSFSLNADSDLLEITVAPVCTVSVEASHVTLYDTDGYAVQGAVKLEKNKPFTFRAVAEDGYKISYITTDGKESGRITPEEKNGFDWYTVTVTEDMTITAVSEENQQCQVTFQADSKLTLKEIKASFTEGSPLYEEKGALSGTVEAWKNVPMYFAVVNNTQGSARAAAAGAELTPCGKSDYGNDVYKLVPTENVTVTLNCDPYTLRINCEENVMETFQVAFEEGYSGSAVISEDQTTVSLLEEVLLNFTYKPKDGKTIKVYGFYTENSEDEFGNTITNQYNEEIKVTQNVDNGTYSFSVRADNTLQEIRIVSLCKVTFQVPSYVQIEGENGEILNGTGGWSVQTAKNMPYTFRVILDEEFNLSYNLSYVTTTGDESGKLTGKIFEGDVWYTVTPAEDMTITVVAAQKEFVHFQVSSNHAETKLVRGWVQGQSEDGRITFTDENELLTDISAEVDAPVYFVIRNTPAMYADVWVSATGNESDKLEPYGISRNNEVVYRVVPTKDTTLTVHFNPYTVPVNVEEDALGDLSIQYNGGDGKVTVAEDQASVGFFEAGHTVDFRYKPAAGKEVRIYSVSQSQDVYTEIVPTESGEGYYSFSVVMNDSIKEIKIVSLCTINFEISHASVSGGFEEVFTESASVKTSRDVEFSFDVEAENGYRLSYVTTNGNISGKLDGTENGSGKMSYSLIPTGDMTITVVTTADVSKKLTMVNQAENMQYEVAVSDQVTKAEDADNIYWISADAESFDFTVTVEDKAKAPRAVLRNDAGEIELEGVKGADSAGRITYAFSLEVKDFSNEMEVCITSQAAKNEVVVEYETGAVKSLVMKAGGEELLRSRLTQAGDREEAFYEVPYGASLEITAYASEQYTLCYADITQGTQEPVRVEASGTKYEGTLEITEDTRIQLTAAGKNNEIVKEVRADQSEVALTPMSGVYNLSWDSKYTISLLEGNTKLELTKAEARAVGAEVSVTIRESDQKVADLEIISGDEGRNIKFKVMLTGRLKTADGTYKEVSKVLNMILVTDSITSATIKSPAECIPDARNLYIVRFQAEAGTYSSAGRIGAEVIPEADITEDDLTVEWKPSGRNSGNIIVYTGARIPYGKVATVKLYHIGALPTDEDYYVDGGEVEICVVKPSAWEKTAPEVSLISTDDVSLTLSLKGLDDRRRCINGVQYYRVAVTPKEKDGERIPDSILEATRNPFYIQREFPEYEEETEEVAESSNFKQTVRLIVNSAAYGTGQEWEFDVKVSMVQSYDKTALNAANEAEMLLYRSLETGLDSTVATKDPSFATKVTVKKATTKIYTTQKRVVAASLKFDAKTTCATAGVEDITDCADNEKLIVTVEDGKVIMSASKDTRLGKHTLQIRPFAPSTLYCEAKTLSVTVQKGIESLSVSLPSDRLYKKPGKAGTLKADVIYNAGDVAPQTKKVTWSVVDTDGEPLWQGTDLEGQITVKNGKITVNRNLDVDEMDCQFCVKVTAADFKGNEISAISDVITATTQALEPGTPLIVQWQEETLQYVVVAKDGDSVTTDKLQNAKLVILRKGIEAEASYTEEDLAEVQMEAKQFSVKSSATKSVQLRNDGKDIWVLSGKPAKDIKLTVTANDGGKKTASMKFTIQYAEPEELRLQAEQEDALLNQVSAATENMEIPFYGTVNTKLTLRVMQGSKNADWAELYAYTNHSVKVSGGKILTSDAEKGIYTVVVTGEKATVTFKDGAKGVKKTYTLANKAYSKTKAPSIKIKANTGKTITAGVLTGRTLEYTVDQKKYSCGNKYVMLETHALSEVKKPSDYAKLTGACSTINTCVAVASDGTIKLAFNDSDIPLGSYKLTFTLGIKNESGQFIADAKPVSMTVKVVKPKVIKGSYKANTSYTVKTTAEGTIAKGTSIELMGTSKKLRSVTYTKLQGCNVGGQENKFLKYFALEDNKLILKEDLSKEQIQNGKDDFTGYITYVAEYGDNGYGMPYTTQRKTVKVTIKFK